MITHASLQPELDCELIAFYGELDAAAAPDLEARLLSAAEPPASCLLIDLSGCTFIDSLGVAAVVTGARAMLERERTAAIACDSPQVRRTLALTGVDGVVELYWTRDEAVGALCGNPI
ncbi:MAG: hypothetical protein QOI10_1777 [Solirubrobacterales bacterium]|jgi:anti-anti-sigma factor|nr:hypothetical protein [Solirubrobacterales bacterium]